jgi:hypothetical protein
MKDYFFSGSQYIRVTRNDTGPGTAVSVKAVAA